MKITIWQGDNAPRDIEGSAAWCAIGCALMASQHARRVSVAAMDKDGDDIIHIVSTTETTPEPPDA